MHYKHLIKLRLLLGCGLALSLPALAPGARAQEADARDTPKDGAKSQIAPPAAAPQIEPATQTPEPASDLPTLLLMVQRPAGVPARRDDINTALSLMLRSSLRESRKFQVILYSPDQPSIRRALLEHSIAATELVEPIPAASLQKLAHLIGARYVLVISSALDKAGIKTDVRLQENMGLDGSSESWITPHAEPVSVDAQFGKLRLKTDQMLALTVESIDNLLGIPSHLADNIHMSRTKIIGTPIEDADNASSTARNDAKNKNGKNAKNSAKSNSDPNGSDKTDAALANNADGGNGKAAQGRGATDTVIVKNSAGAVVPDFSDPNGGAKQNAPSETKAETKKDTTKPAAKPARVARTDVKKPPVKKPAAPAKPTRDAQIARISSNPKDDAPDAPGRSANGATASLPAGDRNGVAANAAPDPRADLKNSDVRSSDPKSSDLRGNAPARAGQNDARQSALLATEAGAILLTEPRVIPPVPPTDRVNHEQAADRYRRTGDLPNSIESLRQAINDNPADINLRKKLITAYQDRQLLDQAVSETERAMQIAPQDADLSRLYANSLSAKGDTAGAIKMLRDIIRANPANTAAQVSLGDALLSDSQFADALSAFETAARNDPKSPLPHRRLARVLAARAGGDTAQYALCLKQIEKARSLTPATETQTYQGDYFEIMLLLESRLKDMLDQTHDTLTGSGRRPASELMRAANDLKERAEAASDFLSKMPPAAGQDITHVHYQQGADLLAQTIGFVRKYLQTGDTQVSDSARGTATDALTELNTAHSRLITARAALEKGRAAVGATTAAN